MVMVSDETEMAAGARALSTRTPAEQTVPELLAGYAMVLAELRRRGVVRSANAPAGDYGEWLIC